MNTRRTISGIADYFRLEPGELTFDLA